MVYGLWFRADVVYQPSSLLASMCMHASTLFKLMIMPFIVKCRFEQQKCSLSLSASRSFEEHVAGVAIQCFIHHLNGVWVVASKRVPECKKMPFMTFNYIEWRWFHRNFPTIQITSLGAELRPGSMRNLCLRNVNTFQAVKKVMLRSNQFLNGNTVTGSVLVNTPPSILFRLLSMSRMQYAIIEILLATRKNVETMCPQCMVKCSSWPNDRCL